MSSIALDVGGTYIKAARIENGSVVGPVARRSIPPFVTDGFENGARELSPDELDTAVLDTLRDIGIRDPQRHDVYISGQMAGLAFVDSQGNALENIITWQDTRYTDVDAVARSIGDQALADLGDGLRVGSPAVTLAARVVPRGRYVTSLIAYVAGRVAGIRAELIHATDAGAWGLFDTRRMQWSHAACAAVGLDFESLPGVSRRVSPIAEGSRVFTGIGDQQAALLGAGLSEDQVSVNLATGGQVSILASAFADQIQTRPYVDGRLLHTVTHPPAGRLLARAVDRTFGENSDENWSKLAQTYEQHESMHAALDRIVEGVVSAVTRLDAAGREVLFSGGLVQRFGPLRDAIIANLGNVDSVAFQGDDAALAGLAKLAGESTRASPRSL